MEHFLFRQDKSLLNENHSQLYDRLNKVWENCKELQRICAFHGYCSDPLNKMKVFDVDKCDIKRKIETLLEARSRMLEGRD